jgi:hypothetical protein
MYPVFMGEARCEHIADGYLQRPVPNYRVVGVSASRQTGLKPPGQAATATHRVPQATAGNSQENKAFSSGFYR